MLWHDDETARILAIIRAGARTWTRKELNAILEAGAKRKPVGLDAHSRALQLRYSGNQRAAVAAALARRFPEKAGEMPVAPINWAAFFAASDAGTYTQQPERWLSDADSEKLEDGDQRADDFAWAVGAADLASTMPDAERRVQLLPVVVYVGYDKQSDDDDGRPTVSLYWPHDVVVLTHPSKPTDFASAYVIALRQASPSAVSGEQWWWVWSREYEDHDDGTPRSFGPWSHVRVSTGGEQQGASAAPVVYEGQRLPILLLQIGKPEGSWLVDKDRDIVNIVDELNVSRSNEQYVMDLQGHTQGIYAGNMIESSSLAIGPDKFVRIGPNETITTVDFNPKLSDMREGRKLSLRELAVSRRNSPDAYATEPGPPLSGVSRKIANAPHEAKVDEQRHSFVQFEEQQLLPVLIDVVDTFSPRTIGADVVPHMTPRKPPEFEDAEARQRRSQEALDAGWISPARAAVEAGWYGSVEEAFEAGLSKELSAKAAAPSPFAGSTPASPFADRLLQMRGGKPDDEDQENA